jgi:hypothetical protein
LNVPGTKTAESAQPVPMTAASSTSFRRTAGASGSSCAVSVPRRSCSHKTGATRYAPCTRQRPGGPQPRRGREGRATRSSALVRRSAVRRERARADHRGDPPSRRRPDDADRLRGPGRDESSRTTRRTRNGIRSDGSERMRGIATDRNLGGCCRPLHRLAGGWAASTVRWGRG